MLMLLEEKLKGDSLLSSSLFSSKRYHQRPKETDLIALLETGTVDYIFLYESVSKQHGLLFLPLPDSINLSEPALNDWYAEAKLSVRGSSEGSQILMAAEAITYGLTLLDDAPNKENALVFLRWMLHNEKGLAQMRSNGFDALNPPRLTFEGDYPVSLKNIHLQKLN
jgi:molybdate/tungstate transport system substrate-binding protein